MFGEINFRDVCAEQARDFHHWHLVLHVKIEHLERIRADTLLYSVNPCVCYHGNENVFTVVMLFIASITPSLMPSPESFTPPKGEFSMR